ncbi:TIGR02328 family protein [Sediminibacillus massiliensis]|uniref:TIGR02328 family protein n=1 Tax=Sediminibacillus massiliensis TaxID=1926277 RepID=UPI003CCBA008
MLGQHRECCALRGNGWGKPHSTVNYVFNYPPYKLFQYHLLIMDEMKKRGYNVDPMWYEPTYRGKAVAAIWFG